MASKLPKYSELPLNKGDPFRSAWGLYGKDDQIGALNRLTDSVVLEAAKEIKTGQRVSLNWALGAQGDLPFFGRQLWLILRKAFEHKVFQKGERTVNDDSWSMNTQSSSQWDGLRHFGYQKDKKFYGGVTMDDIHGPNKPNTIGIDAMAEKGIVGRGILLDFHTWRLKNNITHTPFEATSIPLSQLQACATDQGVEFKFGDILIVRSGYLDAYDKQSRQELERLSKVVPPNLSGVEQSEDMLEWIWNNFSVVAGDHPAWECYPSKKDWSLHEVLLGGWGMPIGEMFDLEALAKKCQELGRWSFFVTSEPCNVKGGVASPPNILAIF